MEHFMLEAIEYDWASADSSFDFNGWLLQPGGSIFFTTISRTLCSYALAVVLAECLFRVVPRDVHDWNKFILPEELKQLITKSRHWIFVTYEFGIEIFTIDRQYHSTCYFTKKTVSKANSRYFNIGCMYVDVFLYTVGHKKTPKFFKHNFYNTWPILIEIDMQCLG